MENHSGDLSANVTYRVTGLACRKGRLSEMVDVDTTFISGRLRGETFRRSLALCVENFDG